MEKAIIDERSISTFVITLSENICNAVRPKSIIFLLKSNQPTALQRPFLHPNTTPASTLCNSISEGFQCVTAGLAIVAARVPITWDFSSSLRVFVFSRVYVFFAFATVWHHHFRVFFEEGIKEYHQPIG
jgi:hypothetical protein